MVVVNNGVTGLLRGTAECAGDLLAGA